MVRSVSSTHTPLAGHARIALCVVGVWAATACEGAPVPSPSAPQTPALSPTSTSAGTPSAEPEFDAPPPATLTIDGAQQLSGIGTFCWSTGDLGGICADYFAVPTPADPLPASSSIIATLQLAVQTPPTSLSLAVFAVSPETDLLPDNPDSASWPFPGEYDLSRELRLESRTQFELALDPGLYVFSIFAVWEHLGDVNYGFLVEVR
ncbi:MAG: hypothetical protein IIB10_09685 [Chloroflexi bacterium]|nr:hypothetical protein [Chloroflexota bacterium]